MQAKNKQCVQERPHGRKARDARRASRTLLTRYYTIPAVTPVMVSRKVIFPSRTSVARAHRNVGRHCARHVGAFARAPVAGPQGPPAGMGLADKVAFLRRQSTAPASTSTPSPYGPSGGYGTYDLPKGDPAGHGFAPLPRLWGSSMPAASAGAERPDLELSLIHI